MLDFMYSHTDNGGYLICLVSIRFSVLKVKSQIDYWSWYIWL